MIELALEKDLPEILRIYKKDIKSLGIYSKVEMIEKINSKTFYIDKEENKIAGFCSYCIMKRKPRIVIDYLCVDEEFRNNGIACKIINRIIDDTSELNLAYYAECLEGMKNNSFYDKIGFVYERRVKPTYAIRVYQLNNKKIKEIISQ